MKKLNNVVNKKVTKAAVVLGALMGSSSAFAALPAEATTALTSVTDFADSMIAAAWPIVGTITVATIGIKLFKKFTNKAT
jgi:hypothetical protein